MKYDIIIKSIDNGVKVDPEKILANGTASVRKLKLGIIEGGIGLFFTIVGTVLSLNINYGKVKVLLDEGDSETVAVALIAIFGILLIGIVLLSFGVANIVSHSSKEQNASK